MITTEEHAKTKWCPQVMARYSFAHEMSVNRSDDGDPLKSSLCLGSRCMMWTWFETDKSEKTGFCGLTRPF